MEQIDTYISNLSQYPDILIKDLHKYPQLQISYDNLKSWVDKLYNTENYFLITDSINRKYRPSQLTPNSLGSFLWGCSGNYYGDVSKSCSNLCLHSIPFLINENCQYQIWKYDNVLTKENLAKNDIAYIYTDHSWEGFSKEEKEELKNNGVKYVTTLTTENSRNYIKESMKQLEDIQTIGGNDTQIKTKTSFNYFYIFLLLTLIGIGIFIYYKKMLQ